MWAPCKCCTVDAHVVSPLVTGLVAAGEAVAGESWIDAAPGAGAGAGVSAGAAASTEGNGNGNGNEMNPLLLLLRRLNLCLS